MHRPCALPGATLGSARFQDVTASVTEDAFADLTTSKNEVFCKSSFEKIKTKLCWTLVLVSQIRGSFRLRLVVYGHRLRFTVTVFSCMFRRTMTLESPCLFVCFFFGLTCF